MSHPAKNPTTTPGPVPRPLDAIFNPRNVAVIGASEAPASVGRTVFSNLLNHPFGGTVFPVNLKRATVLGQKAYPRIADVPAAVDLAVIVTPAFCVPDVVRQCNAAHVRSAIIISAGFKELGAPGVELERQVSAELLQGTMRVIGPNCLGVMNPVTGMNATFASSLPLAGNVAFISQSGALCTAILDWSLRELVGFSAFVSTGSMLDVGWGELIDHFGDDPNTQSILIYMESIGDGASFLAAAGRVAPRKPIIVIKAGRTQAAAKAAASHTGALTGSDDVLDAAFRRVGVLRVNNIADLFYLAEVLARQPRPRGPRLTILTNAGGPGVLATDALIESGAALAPLSPQTLADLDKILPPHWSRANPVDILGDATPERFAQAVEIAAKDPASDALLVVLTSQDMTDPTRTASVLQPFAHLSDRPLLASWIGGSTVEAGKRILNAAGIPAFAFPDTAARVFSYMWQYTSNLQTLAESPAAPETSESYDLPAADDVIAGARAQGRTLLHEAESKRLLSAFAIPTVRTETAATAQDAVRLADALGYPVVLKLFSTTITHKTDVGGVKLNLTTPAAVRGAFSDICASVTAAAGAASFQGVSVQPMISRDDGYELILGSSVDPQFGPVLLVGTGGQLVEVFSDRALGLPPLTPILAVNMIKRTLISRALAGVRGRKPVNIEHLAAILVRFSNLVLEFPCIKEIDINPLLVSHERMLALDARIVLFPADIPPDKLPRPAMRFTSARR